MGRKNLEISKIKHVISNHKLVTILLAGTIIRLILMPISAHPFDVYAWYTTSTSILKNGPLTLQGFPPLWYHYMMVPVAYTYQWLSGVFSSGTIPMASLPSALDFYPSYNIQYVPGMLFNTIVKTPFLISDIAITLLLYRIVEELTNSKALAEKAAILWFLNPFVIWISAGWGMWDTLPALFSLAAFFFLIKKKYAFSAICLSLGVAAKLYPALFLVPIAIYLLKTSPVKDKWNSCLKFFSVFAVASVLLFLPYLGQIERFFTSYFVPNPSTSGVVVNQVVNPLGFGLTYWSIYLTNRLLNFPVTAAFLSFGSLASVLLVVVALGLVYWKTGKMTFEKPAYDLAFVMLLPVLALFLSYRIICEQWFIWAIPFLVILCVAGRVKSAFYWGASMVALLYVFLNCPLPFFFLPLAPWYTNTLTGMVYAVWAIEPIRIMLLAILGCVFSILLVFILLRLNKHTSVKNKANLGLH